jgi:hypothetical protein
MYNKENLHDPEACRTKHDVDMNNYFTIPNMNRLWLILSPDVLYDITLHHYANISSSLQGGKLVPES